MTIGKDTEAGTSFILPAALNKTGTIFAAPSTTNTKPDKEIHPHGLNKDTSYPADEIAAPNKIIFCGLTLSTNLSPSKRMTVIAIENAA